MREVGARARSHLHHSSGEILEELVTVFCRTCAVRGDGQARVEAGEEGMVHRTPRVRHRTTFDAHRSIVHGWILSSSGEMHTNDW